MTTPATPCQRNPDRWFSLDRKELGMAVHGCLSHCPRLAECAATEARPNGGVLAGVHYVVTDPAKTPQPERRKLHEVPCGQCLQVPTSPPGDPMDTGACGTPKGYHRHTNHNQRPCEPCRLAKAEYQRERYHAYRKKALQAVSV